MKKTQQIPRVIHYCWFGGNPLPEAAVKCIESWQKFCPGYEIVRWDESNYDVHTCAYMEEAYQAKKWAFVSDYARFDILYRHGGLYFDVDVELVAPVEDLVVRGAFLGMEQNGNNDMVAPGLGMAAPAGMDFYEKVLRFYQGRHFLRPDGTFDQTTVVRYTTELLRESGLHGAEEIQCVADIWVYPWDYFCPMKYETGVLKKTDNTRSIHHYSATWFTKAERRCHRVTAGLSRMFGEKTGKFLGEVYSLPRRVFGKIRQMGFRKAMGFAFAKVRNKSK